MKKFIFSLVFVMISIFSFGQTKNGWYVGKNVDTYTQEIEYSCDYYQNSIRIASYDVSKQKILVTSIYNGLKYFNTTWDAMMSDNKGKIPPFLTNVKERLISNNDYKEYDNHTYIRFSTIDAPGDSFVGGFYIDENAKELQEYKSISYKFYDDIKEDIVTINISLIGFTKCYNECIRLNS